MSDPFVAEIRVFGFNFAPKGWALCDGTVLKISQNTALFSLLGTMYGGDGRTTFALPDLRGRAPMNYGNGAGLTPRAEGEVGGEPSVTLIPHEMPTHNHFVQSVADDADLQAPDPTAGLAKSLNATLYNTSFDNHGFMDTNTVGFTGGNQPHNNMQPYLALNFCIALQGIFPARP
jgi:microcystin-dependent protein